MRNLTFAESQILFLNPLAVSGSSGQRVSERMGGDGVGASGRGVEVCPNWWSVQVGDYTGGVARSTSTASNFKHNILK